MGSAARTAKLVAVTLFLFSAINCGALFLILARAFLFWNVPLRLKVDVQIQHLFLSLFTYMIERNANIRVVTTGDAIPERESAMIISNHLNQDWVRGCVGAVCRWDTCVWGCALSDARVHDVMGTQGGRECGWAPMKRGGACRHARATRDSPRRRRAPSDGGAGLCVCVCVCVCGPPRVSFPVPLRALRASVLSHQSYPHLSACAWTADDAPSQSKPRCIPH